MKTAISVPDRVFLKAEQYARRAKKSRSQVYSEAVAEYLARHVPDAITESMNDVCAQLGDQRDDFAVAASRRLLRREKW
jgi:predicted transcriptional regulator